MASTWDAIVIGGGTAGMPTAIFAAERAKKVLLIEKYHVLGGTLDRSSGQIAAAGTKLQKQFGIEDTPDEHYQDIIRINRGTSDLALTRLVVDNAAVTFDWLMDSGYTVVKDHPVKGSGHEFFTKRRYYWGPEMGVTIAKTMQPLVDKAVAKGNLTVMLNTGATELMVDAKGAVIGVKTETAAGEKAEHLSNNVVLASGGFASNPAMYMEHHGVPLYSDIAHPMAQGEGVKMGLAVGGYCRGGDKYLCTFGSVLRHRNFPAPLEVALTLYPNMRMPWEIFVNSTGARFVREDHPSVDHREKSLLAQPGHRHYVVFDQEILDKAPPIAPTWTREQFVKAFNTHPMFTSASTIGELAAKSGLDAVVMAKTIDSYNAAQASGSDKLGRNHMPLPIAKPPYYAIAVQGFTVKSCSGLGIDTQMRVLRSDGSPIQNLYAVGEVIGGGNTSGDSFVNGMMVTPALTFGRMLGQSILKFS
ncbi:MAG: FAD-dependent oxidoreductase [Rhodobacteraceae bacterium]|nr:FAD-dependent oxidoreductase [Paracoccaceae bacterium]